MASPLDAPSPDAPPDGLYGHRPPAAPPLACGITVGRSSTGDGCARQTRPFCGRRGWRQHARNRRTHRYRPPCFGQSRETPAGCHGSDGARTRAANMDTRCLNRGCLTTKEVRHMASPLDAPSPDAPPDGLYGHRPPPAPPLACGITLGRSFTERRRSGCLTLELEDGITAAKGPLLA